MSDTEINKTPTKRSQGGRRDDSLVKALVNGVNTAPVGSPQHKVIQAMHHLVSASLSVEATFAQHSVIEWLPADHKVDTMCVYLDGEGIIRLAMNEKFVEENNQTVISFGILHEMYHLWFSHLQTFPLDVLESLSPKDFEALTLAHEIIVNSRVAALKHYYPYQGFKDVHESGVPDMIVNGEETHGIRPDDMYKQVIENLPDSEKPPTYEEFITTDLICWEWLKKANTAPEDSKLSACAHKPSTGEKGDVAGATAGTIDPDLAADKIEEILSQIIEQAINAPDSQAAKDLNIFLDKSPESPLWSKLPIGILRGKKTSEKTVSWWLQYLRNAAANLLAQGEKLVYNRKIGSWSATPLQFIGDEEQTLCHIYIDFSGSMSNEVLEQISDLVGNIPNCKAKWHSFDAEVLPFKLGEQPRGGGGTSFDAVALHVAETTETPDAVIVVTDGFAPPIDPPHPEKWIWLITKNGDNWPKNQGMQSISLDM